MSMERFQEHREKAKRHAHIADHMLTQTYPMIKDPKLLLAVLENIFLSLTNAMSALLYYERMYKRVPPFHDNFESKFNLMKMKLADRLNISRDYLHLIQEVKNLVSEHKSAPVEFQRKDVFVICSDNYRMQTVSLNQMKNYVSKTKTFIGEVNNILNKDEGMSY